MTEKAKMLNGELYDSSDKQLVDELIKAKKLCNQYNNLCIEDIEKGNGSILMQYFLKYCKTTSAEYVSGMLSPIDADHFDRSEHYYKKHGFTVVFFDEKKSGSIRYELRGQKNIL